MSAHEIYVGCSGWSYSTWIPDFYPEKTPARQLLGYYASQINTVEVNYTFRKLPTPTQSQNWLNATSPGFRFSFKTPQRITHMLRLRNCAEPFARFAESLAPFATANRLGVILVQLPPNFKADRDRLDAFLREVTPHGLRLAFEFRHESWFSEEIYVLLQSHQTALCLAETDQLATPIVCTAPFLCYRLRKSVYLSADIDRITNLLTESAQHGEVYAYFRHEDVPEAPIRARAVLNSLNL